MKKLLRELLIAAIAFTVVFGLLSLIGCDQPKNQPKPDAPQMPRAVMPEGLKGDETVRFKYRADAGKTETHEQTSGTGSGARAVGGELTTKVDSSAPSSTLSGGGGSIGGSARARLEALTPETLLSNPFAWAGIIGLAFAGFLAYRNLWRPALIAAVCSVCLAAAAVYPWTILIALVAGGYELIRQARGREAARAMIQGIEDSPEHVQAAVKANILKAQDPGDRQTIRAIKTADGY